MWKLCQILIPMPIFSLSPVQLKPVTKQSLPSITGKDTPYNPFAQNLMKCFAKWFITLQKMGLLNSMTSVLSTANIQKHAPGNLHKRSYKNIIEITSNIFLLFRILKAIFSSLDYKSHNKKSLF